MVKGKCLTAEMREDEKGRKKNRLDLTMREAGAEQRDCKGP